MRLVYPALHGRATRARAGGSAGQSACGNRPRALPLFTRQRLEVHMLRGGLLWLIGIPLPIILLLFFFGFLN
jgi:hypothetical protein